MMHAQKNIKSCLLSRFSEFSLWSVLHTRHVQSEVTQTWSHGGDKNIHQFSSKSFPLHRSHDRLTFNAS